MKTFGEIKKGDTVYIIKSVSGYVKIKVTDRQTTIDRGIEPIPPHYVLLLKMEGRNPLQPRTMKVKVSDCIGFLDSTMINVAAGLDSYVRYREIQAELIIKELREIDKEKEED